MEMERRNLLKMVDRQVAEERPAMQHAAARERWKEWADRMWSEIARVHALMDKVSGEVDRMVADDSMHALQVLEKNAELRMLQSYDKGLRFAIERKKEIIGRRLIGTANPE